MRKTSPPKKTADWDSADIGYALKKAGWSLRKLSLHHGYKSASTLKHAITRRWPKGERLIAAAIGLTPDAIWPTRYLSVKGSTARESSNAYATDGRLSA